MPRHKHYKTLRERILESISINENGCWIWMKCRDRGGYGSIFSGGSMRGAHKVCYELFVGPVPEGYELHHVCEEKPCCNYDHVTPVVAAEHTRIHAEMTRLRITHCVNGHPLFGANLYVSPGSKHRSCKVCNRNAVRAYERRKSLALAGCQILPNGGAR